MFVFAIALFVAHLEQAVLAAALRSKARISARLSPEERTEQSPGSHTPHIASASTSTFASASTSASTSASASTSTSASASVQEIAERNPKLSPKSGAESYEVKELITENFMQRSTSATNSPLPIPPPPSSSSTYISPHVTITTSANGASSASATATESRFGEVPNIVSKIPFRESSKSEGKIVYLTYSVTLLIVERFH